MCISGKRAHAAAGSRKGCVTSYLSPRHAEAAGCDPLSELNEVVCRYLACKEAGDRWRSSADRANVLGTPKRDLGCGRLGRGQTDE